MARTRRPEIHTIPPVADLEVERLAAGALTAAAAVQRGDEAAPRPEPRDELLLHRAHGPRS